MNPFAFADEIALLVDWVIAGQNPSSTAPTVINDNIPPTIPAIEDFPDSTSDFLLRLMC